MLFYYMPPCDFRFKNNNDTVFELYDNNFLISSLTLHKQNPFYTIHKFYLHNDYKGLGCFRYLIHRAVDIHRNILSTLPELFKYWRILEYYPHFSFHLKFYNNGIISDIQYDELWLSDKNDNILIQKIFLSEDKLKSYEKNQFLKQQCQRDDHSILYGYHSSGKFAFNP